VTGQSSIPCLNFRYSNNSEILTYFTQEMLKNGFLAGSQVSTTFAYNDKIINKYLNEVDKVFKKIKIYLGKKKFPLKGDIKHSTFRRLTG
jgi:glutamate-1-semialdehyde 2,1-aminomutase